MASATPNINKTCLMCLEPQDILKVIGSCSHNFCTRCLTRHLDRHKADDETFPCPICNVSCVLPGGDVNNLPAAGVEEATEVTDSQSVNDCASVSVCKAASEAKDPASLDNETVDVKCQICHYQKKDVQAVNLCLKCDQLHLCEDCTAQHARNKATKDHAVIPLRAPATRWEAHCVTHDATLTKYCCDCQQPMCKIGMMLEHGEHGIEDMAETIKRRVDEVKGVLKQREGELQKLQCFTMQLAALRYDVSAPDTGRQEVLQKEIEDHAEKLMDKIVTWKEDLKEEVNKKFQVVKDIPEAYDTASKVLKKLEKPLHKAAELLSDTSRDPAYLARLISLQKDLESAPPIDAKSDANTYWIALKELFQKHIRFCPQSPTLSLGNLETSIRGKEYRANHLTTTIINVESDDASIPSVAHLGSKLAIANPTPPGQLSCSIHIYDLAGEFCHTLKDNVGPIYDMSCTGDGKIVVLSNGTDDTSPCSIKVLDPDTGNLVIAHNLDVAKPMSLGVSPDNWYYILGDIGQGERQVTTVDVNGDVKYKQTLEVKSEMKDPRRISCGWSKIFVMGQNGVEVLDRKDSELTHVVTVSQYIQTDRVCPKDIYASHFDNLFLVEYQQGGEDQRGQTFVMRYLLRGHQWGWECWYQGVCRHYGEAESENRIAGSGNSFVVSYGKEFRVFKFEF